jgi:hypothetical protein
VQKNNTNRQTERSAIKPSFLCNALMGDCPDHKRQLKLVSASLGEADKLTCMARLPAVRSYEADEFLEMYPMRRPEQRGTGVRLIEREADQRLDAARRAEHTDDPALPGENGPQAIAYGGTVVFHQLALEIGRVQQAQDFRSILKRPNADRRRRRLDGRPNGLPRQRQDGAGGLHYLACCGSERAECENSGTWGSTQRRRNSAAVVCSRSAAAVSAAEKPSGTLN